MAVRGSGEGLYHDSATRKPALGSEIQGALRGAKASFENERPTQSLSEARDTSSAALLVKLSPPVSVLPGWLQHDHSSRPQILPLMEIHLDFVHYNFQVVNIGKPKGTGRCSLLPRSRAPCCPSTPPA
jgi:hypothetical protein